MRVREVGRADPRTDLPYALVFRLGGRGSIGDEPFEEHETILLKRYSNKTLGIRTASDHTSVSGLSTFRLRSEIGHLWRICPIKSLDIRAACFIAAVRSERGVGAELYVY
jgi:hypothetical protein